MWLYDVKCCYTRFFTSSKQWKSIFTCLWRGWYITDLSELNTRWFKFTVRMDDAQVRIRVFSSGYIMLFFFQHNVWPWPCLRNQTTCWEMEYYETEKFKRKQCKGISIQNCIPNFNALTTCNTLFQCNNHVAKQCTLIQLVTIHWLPDVAMPWNFTCTTNSPKSTTNLIQGRGKWL